MTSQGGRGPWPLERRVLLLALAGGALPLLLLWLFGARLIPDAFTRVTLQGLSTLLWLSFAFSVAEAVTRPVQTLSNLLAALREGDTSIRARGAIASSAMGLALHEVNALTDQMRQRRYDALTRGGNEA